MPAGLQHTVAALRVALHMSSLTCPLLFLQFQCLTRSCSCPSAPLAASAFQIVVGTVHGVSEDHLHSAGDCSETFKLASVTAHPGFNDNTNDNDLAILTLASPIDVERKACACTLCLKSRQPRVGESCVVSGVGAEVTNIIGTSWSNTEILYSRSDIQPLPLAKCGLWTFCWVMKLCVFIDPLEPMALKWARQTVVSQTNTTTCPVFQDANTGAITNTNDYYCPYILSCISQLGV